MSDADWVKLLAGILCTLFVGAVCYAVGGNGKQTVEGCRLCREACQRDGRSRFDALFRMMRALIVYSDIPESEKEKILNDRGLS